MSKFLYHRNEWKRKRLKEQQESQELYDKLKREGKI